MQHTDCSTGSTICLQQCLLGGLLTAQIDVFAQVTQLGQVKDLATAFHKILGNPKAKNQIYNISGDRFVTFDGIAKACAKAAGAPEPELVHYNPKDFDFGGKKAFPLRDQHFFASVDKVRSSTLNLITCICIVIGPLMEYAQQLPHSGICLR